jgi:cytosine/adenosine deaminase-related metal-dependent hydrolase
MLQSIKITPLLQRVKKMQATALSARDAFMMATIEGAKVLGVESFLGSIELRKRADFVILDGDSPALANIHDPFQAIVYCAGKTEVKEVWVEGEKIFKDGVITNVSKDEVVKNSKFQAVKLVKAAGLSKLSNLIN